MTPAEQLKRVFYRNGRRAYVEVTAQDAAYALRTTRRAAVSELVTMTMCGHAYESTIRLAHAVEPSWIITDKGRDMVENGNE